MPMSLTSCPFSSMLDSHRGLKKDLLEESLSKKYLNSTIILANFSRKLVAKLLYF
jgi:hypothetical protein